MMEQDFIQICIKKWRWFAASVVSMLMIAILFLLAAVPRYQRTASVMVKDQTGGSNLLSAMTGNMGMLAGLAGMSISSNVLNEIEIFNAPATIDKVIERLDLRTRYQAYDGLQKRDLWGSTLPVKVTFPQLKKAEGAYMKMDLHKDGSYQLYKFCLNGEKQSGEIEGQVGTVAQTPIGKISVVKTKYFDQCFKDNDTKTIRITKERQFDIIDRMQKHLSVDLADDQTSIISISYEDQIEERAELVINTLIKVYQDDWLKDKQDEADISTAFVNQRINLIEQELNGLDSNIAQFRGKNLLPDYEEAAKMYMKNASLTYEAQIKVNNYLYMMEQMRNEIKNIEGKNIVLPANLVPDNPNVALEISEYNKLQTKRNSMVENSNEENPLVKDLDVKLKGMREAIINSLNQGVAQLKAQQRGVDKEDRKLKSEISMAPEKITKILPTERKQKIIEALYIYLLEKREENNITHVFNTQNLRLISPPIGDWKPIFPKKGRTLAAAFLLGLCIPACTIYIRLRKRE